jgi:hypothetical protein
MTAFPAGFNNSLSDWLTEKQASELIAMSVHWFRKKRIEGGGIAYSKIGRACRYRRTDVIAWMESRKISSTYVRK